MPSMAAHIKIDTSAQVGRAVPCPPPFANERVLIHHDGAHGVPRPTFYANVNLFESEP
jgi:hypothetical protein